jgi:hypothetical protein
MNVHMNKSTNESKGKPEQKFDAAFETIFRISKFLQRSKQKFNIDFSLKPSRIKKFYKKNSKCKESILI